jgi:hypothetical protein
MDKGKGHSKGGQGLSHDVGVNVVEEVGYVKEHQGSNITHFYGGGGFGSEICSHIFSTMMGVRAKLSVQKEVKVVSFPAKSLGNNTFHNFAQAVE